MGYVIVKNGEKVEILEEEDFSTDKKEEYLHKLIEKHPYLILKEITDDQVITLASRLRLPSGGELDLLLIDSRGYLTLAELKRGKGHREAIAQLLDYASDLQNMKSKDIFESQSVKFSSLMAVYKEFYGEESNAEISYEEFEKNFLDSLTYPEKLQLILVSYNVGEDTSRLVSWLCKAGIRICCFEFEYFKKENKENREIFIPKFIGSIDEIRRIKEKKITPTGEKYLKFFTEVLSKFKERKPGVTEKRARPESWLQIPTGYGQSIHFEWCFYGREPDKHLDVALHIEYPDEEVNEKLLEYFKSRKDEIEKKIGCELYFGKWGKKWRKISVSAEVGTLDQALKDEKLKNWAVDMMVRFYEALKESGEIDRAVEYLKKGSDEK